MDVKFFPGAFRAPASTLAPLSTSSFTTASWPARAAPWRDGVPIVETVNREMKTELTMKSMELVFENQNALANGHRNLNN